MAGREPNSVVGRGGGTFANHAEKGQANAELVLGEKGAGHNAIFLRVKRNTTINAGDEIKIFYGHVKDKIYRVAMG